MDKLKFETPDMVAGNIEKIGELFPSAIAEMRGEDGQIKKGINFEVLKQLLSRDVVDGDECYEFTWVGKKAAMAEAARPITKTLRPVKEDSLDWDNTQNLYIEGDNLEVLKILQESYLGKVKMIYIDPPYNTGHDFIYNDHFEMDKEEYAKQIGLFDEKGNKQFAENTERNPRFHSDWCSMMYPRLMLARNMLSDDGVIFISIDDNELDSLKALTNEVFGESNFIANIIWQKVFAPKNSAKHFSGSHEYILCYAKQANIWTPNLLQRSEAANDRYKNPDNDPRGPWTSGDLTARNYYGSGTYPITCPGGRVIEGPPTGTYWRVSYETFLELAKDNRIYWGADGNNTPRLKRFLSEVKQGIVPQTLWTYEEVGHTQEAKKELLASATFENSQDVFDTPKPTRLIKRMLQIATTNNGHDIVMDFFSGSATTAHAVLSANAEDDGNRTFIMVQIPDKANDRETLCGIGKERIRRAGDKIKEDNPLGTQDLDTGFRVFRVDSSNMKDVYYHPEELDQQSLGEMISNIKDDRTDLDLLYACLLDWGVEIHLPHTSTEMDGCTVHNVDNGALMACFNTNVPTSVVEYMAKQQPLRAVFRDSAFSSDDAKINVTEIFKNLSPDTKVKVI